MFFNIINFKNFKNENKDKIYQMLTNLNLRQDIN